MAIKEYIITLGINEVKRLLDFSAATAIAVFATGKAYVTFDLGTRQLSLNERAQQLMANPSGYSFAVTTIAIRDDAMMATTKMKRIRG